LYPFLEQNLRHKSLVIVFSLLIALTYQFEQEGLNSGVSSGKFLIALFICSSVITSLKIVSQHEFNALKHPMLAGTF
jgi:hypothetical protein